MQHVRFFLLFSLVALGTFGAWAKPALSRDTAPVQTAPAQTAPEQRRAELRSALKAPRVQEPQKKGQKLEKGLANRHMSTQERADLRQQLRQQHRDAKLDRP